jgi:hypothetical protein
MKHHHCSECTGSGFFDILKQGISFISDLFGKKKSVSHSADYEDTTPQTQESSDGFHAHGERKAYLLGVLGLPKDATKKEAIAAYRKLALKHHPDKGGDAAEFRKLNDAKVELTGSGFNKCRNCCGSGLSKLTILRGLAKIHKIKGGSFLSTPILIKELKGKGIF